MIWKTVLFILKTLKPKAMDSEVSINDLRFIVFLLDRLYANEHEGIVFTKYADAQKFVADELAEYPNYRVIIASFVENPKAKERYISKVQTFGFKGDKKFTNQTKLF